jgi:hypothetical protein
LHFGVRLGIADHGFLNCKPWAMGSVTAGFQFRTMFW